MNGAFWVAGDLDSLVGVAEPIVVEDVSDAVVPVPGGELQPFADL